MGSSMVSGGPWWLQKWYCLVPFPWIPSLSFHMWSWVGSLRSLWISQVPCLGVCWFICTSLGCASYMSLCVFLVETSDSQSFVFCLTPVKFPTTHTHHVYPLCTPHGVPNTHAAVGARGVVGVPVLLAALQWPECRGEVAPQGGWAPLQLGDPGCADAVSPAAGAQPSSCCSRTFFQADSLVSLVSSVNSSLTVCMADSCFNQTA